MYRIPPLGEYILQWYSRGFIFGKRKSAFMWVCLSVFPIFSLFLRSGDPRQLFVSLVLLFVMGEGYDQTWVVMCSNGGYRLGLFRDVYDLIHHHFVIHPPNFILSDFVTTSFCRRCVLVFLSHLELSPALSGWVPVVARDDLVGRWLPFVLLDICFYPRHVLAHHCGTLFTSTYSAFIFFFFSCSRTLSHFPSC